MLTVSLMTTGYNMTRGELYWVDLDPTQGSEADKRRPCVIVSNDANNRVGSTVTVVPVTSNVSKIFPFEVELEGILSRPSKAQANQVRTVSKERFLGSATARLDGEQLRMLDDALRLHLGL